MSRLIEPLSAEKRTAMVAYARSLVGTPFRHRGRSVRGVDCIGLVVLALRQVGVTTADERLYGRTPEPEGAKLRQTLVDHFGQPIPELQPGAIVTMQWHGRPNHVGIVGETPYGELSLIHADSKMGAVVEHRLADPWPRRIVEGWLP
jgi:cell wall-associated NlpC family hydrolase